MSEYRVLVIFHGIISFAHVDFVDILTLHKSVKLFFFYKQQKLNTDYIATAGLQYKLAIAQQ
jgi:hypothetical protein